MNKVAWPREKKTCKIFHDSWRLIRNSRGVFLSLKRDACSAQILFCHSTRDFTYFRPAHHVLSICVIDHFRFRWSLLLPIRCIRLHYLCIELSPKKKECTISSQTYSFYLFSYKQQLWQRENIVIRIAYTFFFHSVHSTLCFPIIMILTTANYHPFFFPIPC